MARTADDIYKAIASKAAAAAVPYIDKVGKENILPMVNKILEDNMPAIKEAIAVVAKERAPQVAAITGGIIVGGILIGSIVGAIVGSYFATRAKK